MSWVEDQWWFGLEDLVIEKSLIDIDDSISDLDILDPKQLLITKGIWLTANREKINIKQMTDRHLYNAIKMIREGRLKREYALPILLNEQERRNGSNKQK